jgi:hypothetical protein
LILINEKDPTLIYAPEASLRESTQIATSYFIGKKIMSPAFLLLNGNVVFINSFSGLAMNEVYRDIESAQTSIIGFAAQLVGEPGYILSFNRAFNKKYYGIAETPTTPHIAKPAPEIPSPNMDKKQQQIAREARINELKTSSGVEIVDAHQPAQEKGESNTIVLVVVIAIIAGLAMKFFLTHRN